MSFLKNAWNQITKRVNREMTDLSEQILAELLAEGYEAYPESKHVVPSFHIVGRRDYVSVGGSFRTGMIKRIYIGSTLPEAKYAVYGNGPGRIYPKNGRALKFKGKGKYAGGGHGKGGYYVLSSVRSYKGDNFVKRVADRHR